MPEAFRLSRRSNHLINWVLRDASRGDRVPKYSRHSDAVQQVALNVPAGIYAARRALALWPLARFAEVRFFVFFGQPVIAIFVLCLS